MKSGKQSGDEFLKVKMLQTDQEKEDSCEQCGRIVQPNHQGFHCTCEKVGTEEYKYLTIVQDIMWFCSKCKNNYRAMRQENKVLKKENKSFRQENDALKRRLIKLENRVENIEKESQGSLKKYLSETKEKIKKYMTVLYRENKQEIIEVLGIQVINELTSKFREEIGEKIRQNNTAMKNSIMQEIQKNEEHQRRINNVVNYSAEESMKIDGKQRKAEDLALSHPVFSDVLHIKELQVESVIRLGRRAAGSEDAAQTAGAKPRPMLVKLSRAETKFEILKQAKQLRNARDETMRKIIIAPDLTKKEREVDRKLRSELKERSNKGEMGWYCKKGQLMRNFQ